MLSVRTTIQVSPPETSSLPPVTGERSPGVPDGCGTENPLSVGAVGYAFEAALAFETVRNLALHYKYDPRFSSLISNLSRFVRFAL